MALRPGSKIRYLLTGGGGCCRQHGRAMGFLDGSEVPDLAKYEEMLREAVEKVLGLLGAL